MKDFLPEHLTLYFVAGTQDVQGEQALPELLEQAIQAGITTFQYREKGPNCLKDPVAIQKMARKLQAICHKHQVFFLINDNLALALAIQADGIHVGQNDTNIQEVIKECKGKLRIGLSCHTLQEVQAANQLSAIDYVGIGPVYPTSSKADAQAPLGVKQLHQLAAASQKAVVAIGGLTETNCRLIDSNKIDGLAVISMITKAKDLPKTIHTLRQHFQQRV
ncbi:thiamine phosphate synthase [Enterococcus sp. LJL98]